MKRIGYIDGRRLSLLDDHAISLGTDRGVTITPSDRGLTIASTWTVPGATGRPLMAQLTTNVSLGSYANAFKAYVDLQSKGGATGLLSASCHEVLMALAGIAGTVAAVEMEITYGATNGALSKPCFMWVNTNGDAKDDFDSYGDLLKIGDGISAGAGLMLSLDSNTLRVGTGALQAVHRYLPLSLTENILHYDVSELAPAGKLAVFTGEIAAPGMGDSQGLFQIGVTVSGEATAMLAATQTGITLGDEAILPSYMQIHTDSIWDLGATLGDAKISWAKYTCKLDTEPTWNSLWEMNFVGADSKVKALFNVNDPALALGYEAAVYAGLVKGRIPIFSIAHVLQGWIFVHGDG